jgi:hypothetical protein
LVFQRKLVIKTIEEAGRSVFRLGKYGQYSSAGAIGSRTQWPAKDAVIVLP